MSQNIAICATWEITYYWSLEKVNLQTEKNKNNVIKIDFKLRKHILYLLKCILFFNKQSKSIFKNAF